MTSIENHAVPLGKELLLEVPADGDARRAMYAAAAEEQVITVGKGVLDFGEDKPSVSDRATDVFAGYDVVRQIDTSEECTAEQGSQIYDNNEGAYGRMTNRIFGGVEGLSNAGVIFHAEGESHEKVREMFTGVLEGKNAGKIREKLAPFIRSTFTEAASRLKGDKAEGRQPEPIDFAADVAAPISYQAALEIIGLPTEPDDLTLSREDIELLSNSAFGNPGEDVDPERAGQTSAVLMKVLKNVAQHRREAEEPEVKETIADHILVEGLARDIIGDDEKLAHGNASLEQLGYTMDDWVAMNIVVSAQIAGYHTTLATLTDSFAELYKHPDQLSYLVYAHAELEDDPSKKADMMRFIGNATNELLRYTSVVKTFRRHTTSDMEIGTDEDGYQLYSDRAGLMHFPSANMDPDVFEDPGRLDLKRENANMHVAFGGFAIKGAQGDGRRRGTLSRHHCAGRSLATFELHESLKLGLETGLLTAAQVRSKEEIDQFDLKRRESINLVFADQFLMHPVEGQDE